MIMPNNRNDKAQRRRRRLARERAGRGALHLARQTELASHALEATPVNRYIRFDLRELRTQRHPPGYVEALTACAAAATEHYITVDVNSPRYHALVRQFHAARRRMTMPHGGAA